MRRSPLIAAAAAVALLSLGACASGASNGAKSEDDIKASLSAHFEDDGLTKDQAECYAELVIDEVGVDALRSAEVGDKEPPSKQQEAYAKAGLRAVDECDIDEAAVKS
jgi:hypothetical protein